MLNTNEIRKNEFWIHVKDVTYLEEKTGGEILEEVRKIAGHNVNITINIESVNALSSQAFNLLYQSVKEADEKVCNVYFSGVHPDLDELIRNLTFTSEG